MAASRFDKIIAKRGESVTLKHGESLTLDEDWGSPTNDSWTDEDSIIGYFEAVGLSADASEDEKRLVELGIIKTGDLRGYIQSTVSIEDGDIIVRDSTNWEVKSISTYKVSGNKRFYLVFLSRVE